jgi:uncharacterized Zn-binding protein involved in type VI secretion
MKKNVIRLGDATSHGGKVIDVRARHFQIGQIPDGIPVAYDSDVTSCGAQLKSSLTNFHSAGQD